jgi:hypothetical protein
MTPSMTPVWVYNDQLTVEYVEDSPYLDMPSPHFAIHTPGATFCLRPDVEAARLVAFLREHGTPELDPQEDDPLAF